MYNIVSSNLKQENGSWYIIQFKWDTEQHGGSISVFCNEQKTVICKLMEKEFLC